MELKALKNWKVLSRDNYDEYGVIEVGFMKCEVAYLKNYKDQNIVITLYNYGAVAEDAFEGIEQALLDTEKENYLVDGDPDSPGYEDTSLFSCVFKDRLSVSGYDSLAVVSRILLPEGRHSYVFQLYVKNNSYLQSVQFKFAEFDEKNIEKSLSEDETFAEVINAIC